MLSCNPDGSLVNVKADSTIIQVISNGELVVKSVGDRAEMMFFPVFNEVLMTRRGSPHGKRALKESSDVVGILLVTYRSSSKSDGAFPSLENHLIMETISTSVASALNRIDRFEQQRDIIKASESRSAAASLGFKEALKTKTANFVTLEKKVSSLVREIEMVQEILTMKVPESPIDIFKTGRLDSLLSHLGASFLQILVLDRQHKSSKGTFDLPLNTAIATMYDSRLGHLPERVTLSGHTLAFNVITSQRVVMEHFGIGIPIIDGKEHVVGVLMAFKENKMRYFIHTYIVLIA